MHEHINIAIAASGKCSLAVASQPDMSNEVQFLAGLLLPLLTCVGEDAVFAASTWCLWWVLSITTAV